MPTPRRLLLASLSLAALGSGCAPSAISVQRFPSTPDAVRALRGGTVEAVYGDWPAMAYAARESAGTLEVVDRQFHQANFGIAVARDATALQGAVAAALAALMADGSYQRIINSWGLRGGRVDPPAGAASTLPEAASVAQLADGSLRVGMEISFAPMGFQDEAGQLAGVDVELARAIGERLGVEVELVDMEFDTLLGALGRGEVDVAISAITVTEERQAEIHLIEYLRSGSAILVRRGNPGSIEYPDDLCGRPVGVQEGTVQVGYMEGFRCR